MSSLSSTDTLGKAAAIQDAVLDKLPGAMLQTAGGILEQFWPFLLLALALSLLGRFLRSPTVKGRFGEAVVSVGALKRLDPKVFRVFNDVVLPRPDGEGTTQIDHVVVSPFGIFVIETKNYRGWIFGDETSRYWTKVIYGKKSRFQNPLHQNALHIRALAKATSLPIRVFQNLIYFAGDATLKTPLPPRVMTEGLAAYIRGHRVEVIARRDVAWAFTKIKEVQSGSATHRPRHRDLISTVQPRT